MLKLEIDWHELHQAFQMAVPNVHYFLCKESGQVVKVAKADHEAVQTIRSQEHRYVSVGPIPSRIQYAWLERFIDTLDQSDLKELLQQSINGKGAFRRFKDVILHHADERRQWFELRDTCLRERIQEWVYEHGIDAQNPPPWCQKQSTQTNETEISSGANGQKDINTHESLDELLQRWAVQNELQQAMRPGALSELAVLLRSRYSI